MESKVTFGLSNVHIAKLTETAEGITYETPFALPGAVSLTMDKEGATSIFYADNIPYYKRSSNNGYSGTLTIADVIEKFLTDILGQEKDTNGAIFENADDNAARFALMCEIDGDVKKRRIVFYDCLAERPSIDYSTTEQEIEVKQASMDLTISQRTTDKEVKSVFRVKYN